MKNKIVCISQARMTSERLPGKVMKEINGKPLISYHIERLKNIRQVDEIVIATTTNMTDDTIEIFARQENITCFRGDEHDVLGRYYNAAMQSNADLVLRVTSDCPLLDPALHDKLITKLKKAPVLDGCSINIDSFCRGLDGELFTIEALSRAHEKAINKDDREHVTRYFYQNISSFKWDGMINDKADISQHRLCVDTESDFLEIQRIINLLDKSSNDYSWENIIKLAY